MILNNTSYSAKNAFQSLTPIVYKTQDLTDRAFNRRISEYKQAKEHLEQQHSETIVKIGEMDSSIKSLEKAIASKQGPLATCQQRLQQRKQR